MNDKTGSSQGPRRTGALAVMAAVAVLITGCSIVHVHFGSPGGPASAKSATYQEDLAYAQCMRAHGLTNFPVPNPSETSGVSRHVIANPNGPAARANDACQHLLSGADVEAGS